MSLVLDGVWKGSAAWASTVWGQGVWFEGASQSQVTGFTVALIPVQPNPPGPSRGPMMDWSWLEYAYREALASSRQLGEEHGVSDNELKSGEEWAEFDNDSLDPDPSLFGKRKKRRAK